MRTAVCGSMRRCLRLALTLTLAASLASPPLLAQEASTFTGAILDPQGKPAEGFKVVLQDVESGTIYTSAASDATGLYSMEVPVGARYRPIKVVAPDGTEIDVKEVPPYAAEEAIPYRLDITFTRAPAAPAGASSASKPWWKRPGIIAGIVVGAVAIGAAIANQGDDEPSSPSAPN